MCIRDSGSSLTNRKSINASSLASYIRGIMTVLTVEKIRSIVIFPIGFTSFIRKLVFEKMYNPL